jgi:cysteine synthase A
MEGVGLDRLTANFVCAKIDAAFRVTDAEAIAMARRLLTEEGLFVGGSSGMNCVGVLRAAERMPPGSTIVTVLCDSGQRYIGSLWGESKSELEGGEGAEGDVRRMSRSGEG